AANRVLRGAVPERDRGAAERAARHGEVVDPAGAPAHARAAAPGGMALSEHREEHLDGCAALALGSVDPADRQAIEAHLSEGCPICEAALSDFSAAIVLLAASAPASTPPPGLREQVMA